jgi:hypothetical protein
MAGLASGLARFVDEVLPAGGRRPRVTVHSVPGPVLVEARSDEWKSAFGRVALGLPPYAVALLVTELGLWDRGLGRFIFAANTGRATVVSTRRFREDGARIEERLKREMIRALGMALGTGPCPDDRCVLTYHRLCADLDRNEGICPSCRSAIEDGLMQLLREESGGGGSVVG